MTLLLSWQISLDHKQRHEVGYDYCRTARMLSNSLVAAEMLSMKHLHRDED